VSKLIRLRIYRNGLKPVRLPLRECRRSFLKAAKENTPGTNRREQRLPKTVKATLRWLPFELAVPIEKLFFDDGFRRHRFQRLQVFEDGF
jgi:hypothetical protein